MSDAKVLEKVRKLLAMANHENANETERETAMRQAHALLTKHGLDLAHVENHVREKMDPRGEFKHEDWSIPWTRSVRAAIAKLFMCKYFYGERINATRQYHYFVGRESNATTAEYMSVFVVGSILKEGRRRYGQNLCKETRAFGEGAAARLHQRVDQMITDKVVEMRHTSRQEREQANHTGQVVPRIGECKGLALITLREQEELGNDDFVKDWDVKKSRPRTGSVDRDAYNAGKEHANSIGLNVQVSTTADVPRIK